MSLCRRDGACPCPPVSQPQPYLQEHARTEPSPVPIDTILLGISAMVTSVQCIPAIQSSSLRSPVLRIA